MNLKDIPDAAVVCGVVYSGRQRVGVLATPPMVKLDDEGFAATLAPKVKPVRERKQPAQPVTVPATPEAATNEVPPVEGG